VKDQTMFPPVMTSLLFSQDLTKSKNT